MSNRSIKRENETVSKIERAINNFSTIIKDKYSSEALKIRGIEFNDTSHRNLFDASKDKLI